MDFSNKINNVQSGLLLTEHPPELKYFPVHDIYRCVESIKLVVMDVHRKHCFHPGTSPNEKSRAARSHCNFDSIDHQHKGKEQPFLFGGKGKEQLVSSRLALRIRL